MIVILIRTLIVYLLLTLVMRLMGKRQLGELQISELISTLVLSEVAAIPIADPNLPILYCILPVGLIFSLEVILPGLFFQFPKLRKWVEGTPSFLIQQGMICQSELRKNRITPEEFLAALRQSGYSDPQSIQYAILEASGMISVFAYTDNNSASDTPQSSRQAGIAHLLVSDGRINTSTVSGLGLSEEDVLGMIRSHNGALKDVFLLTQDDNGQVNLIWKEPT